ncbi:MAG: ImmA/IrrE family metallo-endopeptidase [Spirochaetaceae bacterium]|nr:ImmA/IrrE family metallo-endopeptidase [Spirochaetaceae bacterium]
MKETNTNTITIGKNLTSIISYLNLSNKMAADEIGISYNTLSNIKNGNFPISAATMEKIENFLTKHNLDVNLLYKENIPVRNFRLRIQKTLSGNEKSALRNTVAKLEKLFVTIDTLEDKKKFFLFGYFDRYELPYGNIQRFDASQRLYEFIKIICEKTRTPLQWASYFLNPTNKEFWGNLYLGFGKSFPINYSVECLGIRIHYMSFGTEKVESCSTSIMDDEARTPNVLWAKPSIIINTDACNTAEKCLLALAKELFHMISDYNEYDLLSCTDFKLESPERDNNAETFAKELLLPESALNDYIKKLNKRTLSVNDLSIMKNDFKVGYELLIERLNELNLCSLSPADYLDGLHSLYAADKPIFHNSEPDPVPMSFRGEDFFVCAILAAYEKNLLTKSECAEYLDCTEEELDDKKKAHIYSIKAILDEK